MAATQILPDPKTETIKLGKGPRRYYRWSCGWAAWPATQGAEDYAGTPATHRDTRHAAALSRLIFMTRTEALELAEYHISSLSKALRKMRDKGEISECNIDNWWERAEGVATIRVPAWLARDLDRIHDLDLIKSRAAAATIYTLPPEGKAGVRRWCKYAEQRAAEAKRIDDEAFAALSSVMAAD